MTATNPLLTPTWNRHHLNGTDVTLPDMGCTDGPVMADADAVSITVPETITNEQLATIQGMTITVNAYAIQADGFADAAEAWAAIK